MPKLERSRLNGVAIIVKTHTHTLLIAVIDNINVLDGVPVPERAKAATRQMITYNF